MNPQRQSYFSVSSVGVPIRNTADYSPFGVQLDGRTISMDSYRYGFQNQEKDDEIKGVGNSVNYSFRMHDPRVGRFFSVDPLSQKYPWYTPYQFSGNKVIWATELEGLEENYTNEGEKQIPGETIGILEVPQQGPRSDMFLDESSLLNGDTKASTVGIESSVEVFTGAEKIADGGKLGGHAIITIYGLETKKEDYPNNWENDFVFQGNLRNEKVGYSFSNKGRNHLFAKSNEKSNSKFGLYDVDMMTASRKARPSEVFPIDLTLDQVYGVIDAHQGKPNVYYSIAGWRCSSFALKTLRDVGVFELNDIEIKYIHAISPGALIRFMDKKHNNE